MSAQTISLTTGTNALFQVWGTAFVSALTAAGWVQTTDTGQVDTTTMVLPGANLYAGYQIWKMGDALQGASPFFIRLDFGSGATNACAAIKVQLGTATNGAGVLTGVLSLVNAFVSASATPVANCYFSGSTSRFCFALWPAGANCAFICCIERDKDATGNDTAEGAHIFGYKGSVFSQYIPKAPGPAATTETKLCALISGQISQASGGVIGLGLVRPASGPLRFPSRSLLVCSRGDFADQIVGSYTVYGASHYYIALTYTVWASFVGNNSAAATLMLFE